MLSVNKVFPLILLFRLAHTYAVDHERLHIIIIVIAEGKSSSIPNPFPFCLS